MTPLSKQAHTPRTNCPWLEGSGVERDDVDDIPGGLGVCPSDMDMRKVNTHPDGWTPRQMPHAETKTEWLHHPVREPEEL